MFSIRGLASCPLTTRPSGRAKSRAPLNSSVRALGETTLPSKSFRNFESGLRDPRALISTHASICAGLPGKKKLGHLTRSGIFMACAAWEYYVESLMVESAEFFNSSLSSPNNLPKHVQKAIAQSVKTDKNELAVLSLSGLGWKIVYLNMVKAKTDKLNTPKSHNLVPLFKSHVGIDDIVTAWSSEEKAINDVVSMRGDIAHQGSHAPYVKISTLTETVDLIRAYAVETDNMVSTFLRDNTPQKKKPWNITS